MEVSTQVMELQIEELLKLQSLDNEIGRLREERESLDRGERVERALALRQGRLDTAESRLHAHEVEQKSGELERKALEEKKHQESQRLYSGRITAPRELVALEQEIAMIDRQRQRLEENMSRRAEEMQRDQEGVDAARAAVEEAAKALEIVRRRYDKASSRIESALQSHEPERERLAKAIAPDVLRRYDEIRRRSHNLGAVRVQNGACGGCRMKVGGALFRRVLANDHYVYCESCQRFLFPPEEGEMELFPPKRRAAASRKR